MKRLLAAVCVVILASSTGSVQAQPVLNVIEVASTWERVLFTGDSLGYGVFLNHVDSTRTDRAILFYNDKRVPTAWRAEIAGQEYIQAPGFGVFAITDSVRIAKAVLEQQPNVLDALLLISMIEDRTQAALAQ